MALRLSSLSFMLKATSDFTDLDKGDKRPRDAAFVSTRVSECIEE